MMVSPEERDDELQAEDGDVCMNDVEGLRTSLTTTTMKKGNFVEKEKADENGEPKEILENIVMTDDES